MSLKFLGKFRGVNIARSGTTFPLSCARAEAAHIDNFKAPIHYERGIRYSLFVLLSFLLRLALKRMK